MRRWVRRGVNILLLLASTNFLYIARHFEDGISVAITVILLAVFLWVNVRPIAKSAPMRRIYQLRAASELLHLFLITATVNIVWYAAIYWTVVKPLPAVDDPWIGLYAVLSWVLPAWNGMIRVCVFSRRLERRQKVRAALTGWIPILNIWYLRKIIRMVSDEAALELLRADPEGPDK